MEDQIEEIRLLARFKLQVRRVLNQSIDLERLTSDPAYAAARLAQVEESANDEELLIMVLRLREKLISRRQRVSQAVSLNQDKKYLFGARS